MTEQDITLQPEQEQAIALILTGQTDQAIGEAVGVTRQTVNGWRNHNPDFMAVLNQRRAAIWEAHVERLRGMAAGALDVLADAVGLSFVHVRKWAAARLN
jgi:DNA-binding CsgD family transcriptional regulator